MKTHPATNDRIENLKNKIPSQTADVSLIFDLHRFNGHVE